MTMPHSTAKNTAALSLKTGCKNAGGLQTACKIALTAGLAAYDALWMRRLSQ